MLTLDRRWVLTEGGVHQLVSAKEHLSVQAGACVSCGQAVINALLISITLRDQIFTRGVVLQLEKEDRGEVGRQRAVSLAKESRIIDFPGHSKLIKLPLIAFVENGGAIGHPEVIIWIVVPDSQEALCAVSILLWEAAGGMEDVGKGGHGDGHGPIEAG